LTLKYASDTTSDTRLRRGIAKLVKALDFDSSMRRFESFFPCQNFSRFSSRLQPEQVHDEQ
jgi:hypothetical protein